MFGRHVGQDLHVRNGVEGKPQVGETGEVCGTRWNRQEKNEEQKIGGQTE